MKILAIETSCDDTAIALIEARKRQRVYLIMMISQLFANYQTRFKFIFYVTNSSKWTNEDLICFYETNKESNNETTATHFRD